ncbi:MAG: hypothetical protein IT514_13055 [Burkholderiales bacterium]|nr:hypothetical protein [Burkholderiales bacterium]
MATTYEMAGRNRRPVSEEQLDAFLARAVALATRHGVDVATVVQAARVCELRRANDLRADAGDILDDQLADFGEMLRAWAGLAEE